ncbi:UNVERIFIED_CONTAM: hypothetical protein K2H54_060624 [Gekko kuhli]
MPITGKKSTKVLRGVPPMLVHYDDPKGIDEKIPDYIPFPDDIPDYDDYDQEQNETVEEIPGLRDLNAYGCTTAATRHLCNTTQEERTVRKYRRNVTSRTEIICCTSSECNDDRKFRTG